MCVFLWRRRRTLTVLRAIALVLLIPWLLVLYRVIDYGFGEKRLWPPVDYRSPPGLSSPFQESLRLNELLAHHHYVCNQSMPIPDSFSVCLDLALPKDQLVLFSVVHNMDSGIFEKAMVVKLGNDVQGLSATIVATEGRDIDGVNHFPGSLSPSDWSPSRLASKLPSPHVAKFDCTQTKHLSELPTAINELLDLNFLNQTRLLHLVIRIPSLDIPNAKGLIHEWYLLLHRLFYRHRMVLYDAQQSGMCGREVNRCKYMISLVRIDDRGRTKYLAPVMGMGSPQEEFGRLFSSLERDVCASSCSELGSVYTLNTRLVKIGVWPIRLMWYFCLSALLRFKPACNIYIFQISTHPSAKTVRQEMLNTFPNEGCKVYIFDPDLPLEGGADKIVYPDRYWHLERLSLSSGAANGWAPGKDGESRWRLESLERIMERLGHKEIQALVLDLEGAEWQVMESLLSSGVLRRVGQITARLSVWFGEENEHYRQYFSWLLRLRSQGFVPFWSRKLRFSEEIAENCAHTGCVEVGWVNERFGE